MIEYVNGHWRSVRTTQEGTGLLEKDLETLSPEERTTIEYILAQLSDPTEDMSLLQTIGDLEWIRSPVDMETFCMDPYYLGNTCDTIYPVWLRDLTEIFAGDYREAIFTGAIGTGKCVHPDTEVYDVSSGRRRKVSEFGDFYVTSMLPDGTIAPKRATAFPSKTKECVHLTLRGGQSIILSCDHPVFTGRGWVRADEITLNDLVATPRKYPEPFKTLSISDEEVALVAFLMADGGCTESTTFTKESSQITSEYVRLVESFGGSAAPLKHQNAGKATTVGTKGIRDLVKRYKLDVKSIHKRAPVEFYGLSDKQLALFLNRFWACDGFVNIRNEREVEIEVILGSEKLIDDLQFMLRRLGIHARKSFKKSGYKTKDGAYKRFDAWRLVIGSREQILLFLDRVGDLFSKEKMCQKARQILQDVEPNTNVDLVPVFSADIEKVRSAIGRPIPKKFKCSGCQGYSRATWKALCEELEYDGELAWLANTDLFWEGVKSIESVGRIKLCDVSVPSTSCFVGNDIVVHNTFAASVGICRLLYILSCMRDPHRSFGIAANSNISIVCLSVSEILATKVAYENIATKIEASPYFQEHFPFEKTKKELRFPKKVWVAARASNDGSVLGLNVISCLLDETNFMPKASKGQDPRFNLKDRAEVLYNAIQRRMKSRFERKGRLPGILFVVSSKQTNDDFTARRIRESIKDPTVFVADYALWDTKPEEYYSGDWFHIVVGNENSPSRIVAEDEDVEDVRRVLAEDCVITAVPEDYRQDFETDLEGSIRDLAGVATISVSPYIQRRTKIVDAIRSDLKHPFSVQIYDPSQPGNFYWHKMVRMNPEAEGGSSPILNPYAPRHIHIDPSSTGDATGFVMAHISGWREVVRRDDEGKKYPERAPEITCDVTLKIVPPIGSEIILGDIRKLVYQLARHGYMITCVSIDSWNSVDVIQKLTQRGFNAIQLSVDRTTGPYDLLKTALYENRLFYYDYPPLLQELRELEYDRAKRKIDHPLRGCFVGSTRIPLLNGTHPCIHELVGKEVWVYSARSDGTVTPGRARGRRTKVTTDFVDVVLDSGAIERCTPEHLWMLRDGTYKEARHLRPGVDRLMPINRQWPVKGGYERISDKNRVKLLTHHAVWMIMNEKPVPQGCCIHHLNGVKTDNRPENLELVLLSEYARDHTARRHREDAEWRQKLYVGAKEFNESDEGRRKHSEALRRTIFRYSHEDFIQRARKNPNFRSDISEFVLERLKDDPEAVNANAAARILGCGRNVVIRVLREMGYSSWEEYLSVETGENHKVRDVIPVRFAVPVPAYDLDVDIYSNFALTSGVFVHNSKDISDALAGVVWTLNENSSSLPLAILKSVPDYGDAWMVEHQQASLASRYRSEDTSDEFADLTVLPPFLMGGGD